MEYLRRNNGMSDSVLRYMERKRRPFGREVDYKLMFVYKEQFSRIRAPRPNPDVRNGN